MVAGFLPYGFEFAPGFCCILRFEERNGKGKSRARDQLGIQL